MKIIDYINCNNDNIISKESKMIANVLLSGTPYQIYNYKQISDEVYNKYGCYIRFNYLDKTASQKTMFLLTQLDNMQVKYLNSAQNYIFH